MVLYELTSSILHLDGIPPNTAIKEVQNTLMIDTMCWKILISALIAYDYYGIVVVLIYWCMIVSPVVVQHCTYNITPYMYNYNVHNYMISIELLDHLYFSTCEHDSPILIHSLNVAFQLV